MCYKALPPLQALSLLPLYLVSLGGVLNHDGYYLYTYYSNGSSKMNYQDFVWVEFVGGLGALLFCVSIARTSKLDVCRLCTHVLECTLGSHNDRHCQILFNLFPVQWVSMVMWSCYSYSPIHRRRSGYDRL